MSVLLYIHQNQLLLGNIDIIDSVTIDNQAFAYADKSLPDLWQLVGNQTFQLTELQGNHPQFITCLEYSGIVAIRNNTNNVPCGNTHEVITC